MRTKKIIFSQSVKGHYLEYLHHLYMGCLDDKVETVFIAPVEFETQRKLFEWPHADHVRFDLKEIDIWSVGKLKRSYLLTKLLIQACKEHQADSAFLLDIDLFMPILPILYRGKARISGILYGIYLYRWKGASLIHKIYFAFTHWSYSKARIYENIFVLNSHAAPRMFNRLYHSSRFVYLPDPILSIKCESVNLRKKYGIRSDQKIFFHFGSMGKRKGTLLILESILQLNSEEKDKYVFVFAGVIQEAIKKEFHQLAALIGDESSLLVFDRFCDYQFFANWCNACDAILVPYFTSFGSSGVIGYAAQFRKPVITSGVGMVAKLVRTNHLGIQLKELTTDHLLLAYKQIDEWEGMGNRYAENNTVEKFNTTIYGCSRLVSK